MYVAKKRRINEERERDRGEEEQEERNVCSYTYMYAKYVVQNAILFLNGRL